jgi:sugar transferase (PEP-CTERM/EpsH1 system associated)
VKLLYICHRLPFPSNRGGKIRPFQMIQHLSRTHEVTVASLAHTEQELRDGEGLKEHCTEVIAEILPSPVRWMNAAGAVFSQDPSSVAYFRSLRLARRIRQAWERKEFHGVMVHCAFVAQYALRLRGGFRIMDYGDLDSAKWLDYSRCRSFPLSFGYGLEARKLRQYEKQVAREFDHCTFTTRGELEEFQTMELKKNCTVIPNGVDINFFQRPTPAPAGSKVIVFLGRMDYFPNVEGICRFARMIFPNIRERVPEAQLRIIGSNPVKSVKKLSEIPGISVTGFVPDVRPFLADAAVAVAPLRIARGTQNKVLECMAMGIPVVTTPEAARGIQASPADHFVVAQDGESFGSAVINLLGDPALRARLSQAGRKQVEQAHRWPASMQILDGVLERFESSRAEPAKP